MSAPTMATKRRPGRPRSCPLDTLVRVVEMKTQGARHVDICAVLNAEAVPTPGGGARWWPSHVTRLLDTYDAKLLAASRPIGGQWYAGEELT